MATSVFRRDGEDENMECVEETGEYICGWCGHLLIPNHNNETPQAHFKSCLNSKHDGLVTIFKELRKVQRSFQVLNADMKEKMDIVKTEVIEEVKAVKTELHSEILALKAKTGAVKDEDQSTLLNKVKLLEEGMTEKLRVMGQAQEIKMAKVKGRFTGVTETISTVVQSMLEEVKMKEASSSSAETSLSNELERSKKETEALWVQLRKTEGDIRATKTQLDDKVAHLETGMETFSAQLNTNEQEIQAIKTQLEDKQETNKLEEKMIFHLEPSPFDQLAIPVQIF